MDRYGQMYQMYHCTRCIFGYISADKLPATYPLLGVTAIRADKLPGAFTRAPDIPVAKVEGRSYGWGERCREK